MSELAGMRQLQQTVERLANRVSCVSTELETEKCSMLLVSCFFCCGLVKLQIVLTFHFYANSEKHFGTRTRAC
jgi:hypothetical protein